MNDYLNTLKKNIEEFVKKEQEVSLKELYSWISEVSAIVKLEYPEIPCKSGCSLCCQVNGLPPTTAIEWKAIHEFLLKMDFKVLRKILKQNQLFYSLQISTLVSKSKNTLKKTQNNNELHCSQCPFLINHKCSIYPVRPAICRGFGYFAVKYPEDQKLLACSMISFNLDSNHPEEYSLPFWNLVGHKIMELNEDWPISFLPLWLFAHTQKGKLSKQLNMSPDFKKLKVD